MTARSKTPEELANDIEALRKELAETRQTLEAIREGAVDALIVKGKSGDQVFTLKSADHPYRILLEQMGEGALTLSLDGVVLFSNHRFAQMVDTPLEKVIGGNIKNWLDADNNKILHSLLKKTLQGKQNTELNLNAKDGKQIPVYISMNELKLSEQTNLISMVVTDLTDKKAIDEIILSKKIALANLKTLNDLQTSLEDSIKAIASTVDARDEYTAGHMKRVGQLASAIAKEMGLAEDMVHGIELAANIHDVGKISIPVEILTKPRDLSKIEYMLVQTHVIAGYNIIKNIKFPWPIADYILQHHERLDGSGYPNGLKGNEILLGSKIIAVADVIEAMSMHRPYRFGLGLEAALAEIKQGRGTFYDPTVVNACIRLFEEKEFSFS